MFTMDKACNMRSTTTHGMSHGVLPGQSAAWHCEAVMFLALSLNVTHV